MDPATGKPLESKGSDSRSTLSSNGRVSIRRKRWQALGGGGVMPVDALLDAAEATVSLGTRNLCCRINATAKSFRRTAEQLKYAAHLSLGESLLREVVESEGKQVLASSESGALKPQWQARDCKVKTPAGQEVSRVYLGIDGFMVPILTEEEKCKRRQKVVAKRAKRAADKPELPPLPTPQEGERMSLIRNSSWCSFTTRHWSIGWCPVTRKPCQEAARIMRRDARRIGFEQADERVGNVDGGSWIVNMIMNWSVVLTALCLDFWHLGQNVNQGKRLTFGEDNPAGEQWAAELMHQVRHNRVRIVPGPTDRLAWETTRREKEGGRSPLELRFVAQGHDRVRAVRAQGLAHQQFDNRKSVRRGAAPCQGSGQTMGRGQRRGGHRP